MKKIILILLSCLLFMNCSFAATISYGNAPKEIATKAEKAVSDCGYELFCDFLSADIENGFHEMPSKASHYPLIVNTHATVGNSYLVSYTCDGVGAFLSATYKKFGKYVLIFTTQGNAVYVADEDKLIGYEEAYNAGLITDEDIDSMYSYQSECESKGVSSKLPFTIVMPVPGDIDFDGEVDINDLVILRSSIVKCKNSLPLARELGDINGDGVADITDIVLIRSKIINS